MLNREQGRQGKTLKANNSEYEIMGLGLVSTGFTHFTTLFKASKREKMGN